MDRRRRIHVGTIRKIVTVGAVAVVLFFIIRGVTAVIRFSQQTVLTPALSVQLITNDGIPLKSSDGRTNILILGIGGGVHEGADLTDTMMIISLKDAPKSMAFISVPRDLWSETLKDKINSAYHYGEENMPAGRQGKRGGGLLLARVVVEDVVGIPVHYTMVIDFSGFKDIVDLLHGIDVNVEKGFTDNEFPIAGKESDECGGDPEKKCRYETISFNQGVQHMDGEIALKYIRSRHAEGEEGSDFARSRRQQEVLVALKEKFMHPADWFSLGQAGALTRVMDDATETDMNIGELASFGKRFTRIRGDQVKRISFESELYEPPVSWYGRYVLLPKEDFTAIHTYIKNQLDL